MADEAKDKPAPPPAAAPAKKSGLLPVAIAAVVSLSGAVVVGVAGFPDAGSHAQEETPAPKAPKATVNMPIPKVLVNLADDGRGNRLLQAEVTLELATDDVAGASGRFTELLPKVQDRLIAVLSGYSAGDLDGAAAKDFAKTRLIDELNRDVFPDETLKVGRILFTEFVVQ